MSDIHLKIITHEKIVYENDIDEFYVQSKDGRLGILKNHIPILCALDYGVVKVIKDKIPQNIAVMGGILQFSSNQAVILTDIAELDCDIDLARAKEAQKRALARLESKKDDFDLSRAKIALTRAITRISALDNKHF